MDTATGRSKDSSENSVEMVEKRFRINGTPTRDPIRIPVTCTHKLDESVTKVRISNFTLYSTCIIYAVRGGTFSATHLSTPSTGHAGVMWAIE